LVQRNGCDCKKRKVLNILFKGFLDSGSRDSKDLYYKNSIESESFEFELNNHFKTITAPLLVSIPLSGKSSLRYLIT
jgi:hypothetical protein